MVTVYFIKTEYRSDYCFPDIQISPGKLQRFLRIGKAMMTVLKKMVRDSEIFNFLCDQL